MKQLIENILSSTKTGKERIKEIVSEKIEKSVFSFEPKLEYIDFDDLTFKEFLDYVEINDFFFILRKAFSDAAKEFEMGRITLIFSDGSLGIEISQLSILRRENKTWREAFVPKNEIKGKHITYEYSKYFQECAEKGGCKFSTVPRARLKSVIPDYIKYLKSIYNILTK